MYNDKLAVAIKSAGRVLREFKDVVYLPFGSEYSILIKNLNTVRASVKVSIDGNDVGGGHEFIIQPNSELELERSITNENLKEGNRFKFIERTGAIEQHRGIGVEDGIVRVEFDFEQKQNITIYPPFRTPPVYPPSPWDQNYPTIIFSSNHSTDSGMLRSYGVGGGRTTSAEVPSASNVVADASFEGSNLNIDGITVPGSLSSQEFCCGQSFRTENNPRVIVLKLLGETEKGAVREPVTVKAKPKCVTCGRVNKATAKFCTECGTSLEIV
jgi:hypothetical protein